MKKPAIVTLLIALLVPLGGAGAGKGPRKLADQLEETLGARFVKLEHLKKGKHGAKIKVLLKGAPGADATRIVRKILRKYRGHHRGGPHAALELKLVLERKGQKQKQIRRMGVPLGKPFSDKFVVVVNPVKGNFELKLGSDGTASLEGSLRLGSQKKEVRLAGKVQKKSAFTRKRSVKLGDATLHLVWRGRIGPVDQLGAGLEGCCKDLPALKGFGKKVLHKIVQRYDRKSVHGSKRQAMIAADGAPRGKLLRHVAQVLGYRLHLAKGVDAKKQLSVQVGPAWGKKLWQEACRQLQVRCRVQGGTLHAAPR